MENQSVIEKYMNRIFKAFIVGVPSIAIVAAATFLTLTLLGYYPNVSIWSVVLFCITCLIYIAWGFVLNRICEDKDKCLKPKMLFYGKTFLCILLFIQWNFISYLFPSADYWGYFMFFIVLVVPLLDHKLVIHVIGLVVGSMLISWIFVPALLPVHDELFAVNMVLRIIVVILGSLSLWALTYIIQKTLVVELEKIADIDTLTLLKSRRRMIPEIEDTISKFDDGKNPFSVIMCDIDNFKSINDTYGHHMGDDVLKKIAEIFRYELKDRGEAFRFGGEEIFGIINLSREESIGVAETIREKIASLSFNCGDSEVKTTITVGFSVYDGMKTAEQLIDAADVNLYYGKNHGKNIVVE